MYKIISLAELKQVKFDVVQHFGMHKNGEFFIMNTVPPTAYGHDCQDHSWYNVNIKTPDDVQELKNYIKTLFGADIMVNTVKELVNAVNELDKYYQKIIPDIDFGACHICNIPINEQFKRMETVVY